MVLPPHFHLCWFILPPPPDSPGYKVLDGRNLVFFFFFFFWLHHVACGISVPWPLKVCMRMLSHVQFFCDPWTVAHQAPLSMGFSRQEYWSRLPCPSPGDLPHPGIKPTSLVSLPWQADSLPLRHLGSALPLEVQSLNHWTIKEVPCFPFFIIIPTTHPSYYYYYYYTHIHTQQQQQQQHLTRLAHQRWSYMCVEQMEPNAPHSCPNLTISPALLASFLEYPTHPPVYQSQPVDWLPLYKILEGSGSQLPPAQRLGGWPSQDFLPEECRNPKNHRGGLRKGRFPSWLPLPEILTLKVAAEIWF